MALPLEKIRASLKDGLLSFPITDMDASGNFNPDTYRERINWFVEQGVSAIFVAGGTGEFNALSKEEYTQIVSRAAETVNGSVPVIAGAGRTIPEAIEYAKISEKAGIDGLLLFPPYLTNHPEEGTYQYAKAIIQSTDLSVIFYNRSNSILSSRYIYQLTKECPNLIGLKDGTGNIQDLNDIIRTVGDRLVYIGGVPTAEIISEAYLSIGVNTYSSAAFNFAPGLAMKFYNSLRAGDKSVVDLIMKEFYIPFVRLRNRQKGYAVSLIKAGARIIGRDAGDVRPPLVMPNEVDYSDLKTIIDRAKQLAE
jgi:5-dehydro-4-deoxyglucarate dehydratase